MPALIGRLALALCALAVAACSNGPMSASMSFIEAPKQAAVSLPEPLPGARISAEEFDLADEKETGELRLQPGDTLKVSIWGYPELDHVAQVQPNGQITVPLAGELPVADATVSEVRSRIAKGLGPFSSQSARELRTGDILQFHVWREESLRQTAVIDPSGMAVFPLIGSVKAAGRPVEDIRAEAERKLSEHLRDARVSILPQYGVRRMLQDYTVSVLIQQVQPRRVAVIGEVGLQGITDLRVGGMRVVEVLGMHQIKQSTAKLNTVVVIRNPTVGKPRYRLLRLEDYLEGRAPNENIVLRHGDIVIVPKTEIAKVGEFVDLFFTRTVAVFQWWSGMWSAARAKEAADTVRLINESLERSLTGISVNPNPSVLGR